MSIQNYNYFCCEKYIPTAIATKRTKIAAGLSPPRTFVSVAIDDVVLFFEFGSTYNIVNELNTAIKKSE
jgi:hypothetical protein